MYAAVIIDKTIYLLYNTFLLLLYNTYTRWSADLDDGGGGDGQSALNDIIGVI